MGVGVGISVGIDAVRERPSGAPVAETLVRTSIRVNTVVGEAIQCEAAVGDLIVLYSGGSANECYLAPQFQATWNGLSFTVTQQYVSEQTDDWSGEPVQVTAIGTLLVPAGKAGTYDITYDWDDCVMDLDSTYCEKWAGVASGVYDRALVASGNDSACSAGATTPTTNHTLVIGVVCLASIPAREGAWGPGLTPAEHVHATVHLDTAYEIQTAATSRSVGKSGVSVGRYGAIGLMFRAV